MRNFLVMSVIAALSGVAFANEPGKTETGINYNSVEVGYDSFAVSGYTWTGYGLGGNFLLNENIYATVNYSSLTLSDADDLEVTYAGIGYRLPIASSADLFSDISYVSRTSGTTETGYRLTVGAKSRLTSAVELTGAYSYMGISSSSYNAFTGTLKVYATDSIYGYGKYSSLSGSNSITTYSIGLGANF